MKKEACAIVEEDKPETDRKVASDYKYDSACKSWRGPITGPQQTLQITRHVKLREAQKSRQNPQNLILNRKSLERSDSLELDDESDEAQSVVLDFDEMHDADADGPSSQLDARQPTWQVPVTARDGNKSISHKTDGFEWVKPSNKVAVHITAQHHILELEKCLIERENETQILREQLQKAHNENYKLTQELNGYTGKHYKELGKENKVLKSQVARLQRQSYRLDAQMKQQSLSKKDM